MTDIAQLGIEIRVKNLEEAVRKLDDLSDRGRKAEKSVDGLGSGMSKIGGIAGRLGAAITAAFSVAAIVQASRAIYEVGSKFESIRNTLKAVTGDTALAAKEFRFVRDESVRLGVAFDSSAQAYARLAAASKGTTLEGSKTREIFTAVAEASRVLGLSSSDTEGALTALQQMMSKGTVQAEELRGQLGERIPGAFNMAAKAMGVTTKELGKMLEQGEVLAEDLLPRLAQVLRSQYAAGLEEATHTAAAEFERFGTLAQESADIIYQAFSQDLAQAVRGLNTSMASLNATLPSFLAGLRAYANDVLAIFNSVGIAADVLKATMVAAFAPFRTMADALGIGGVVADKVATRGNEEIQKEKLEKLGKEIELISQGRGTIDPLRNKTDGATFDDLDRVLGKVNDKTAAYSKTLEKIVDANKGAGTAEQKRHEAGLEWTKQRQEAERILAEAQKSGDGDLEARAKEAIALADAGYKKAWETAGKAATKAGASAEKASDRIADALREINDEIVVLQNQLSGNTYGATIAEIDADINKKMDDLRDSMKGATVGADQLARALEGLEQERTLKKQIALIEQLGISAVKSTEEQLADLDRRRESWIKDGADRLAVDVRYFQERKAIVDKAYEDEIAASDSAADKYDAYLEKIRAAAQRGGEDRIAIEEGLLERISYLSGDILAIKEEMYIQVVEIAKAAGLSEAQAQELVAQSMVDAKKRQLEAIRDTATSYDQWASAQKGLDDGSYKTGLQRQHEAWKSHYDSLGNLSDGFTDAVVGGLGDIVRAVASGTAEWQDIWQSLMSRLLDVFLSFLEDMLKNWFKNGLGSILGQGLSGSGTDAGGGIASVGAGLVGSIAQTGFSSMFNSAASSDVSTAMSHTGGGDVAGTPWASGASGVVGGVAAGAAAGSWIPVVGSLVGAAVGLLGGLLGQGEQQKREPEEVWSGRSYMYAGGAMTGFKYTQMDDGSYKLDTIDPFELEEERRQFKDTVKSFNKSLKTLEFDFEPNWVRSFSFMSPPVTDELSSSVEYVMKNAAASKAMGELTSAAWLFVEGLENMIETVERLGAAFGLVSPLVGPLGVDFKKMSAVSDAVVMSYAALATGFNAGVALIGEAAADQSDSADELSARLLALGEAGAKTVEYFETYRKQLTNLALAQYSELLIDTVGGEEAFKQTTTTFSEYAMGDEERAKANIDYYRKKFAEGTGEVGAMLPNFDTAWIGESTDAFWKAYAAAMNQSMPPSMFTVWSDVAENVANLEDSLQELDDVKFSSWAWDEELKYRRQMADEQKAGAEMTRWGIELEQELVDARKNGATYAQQAALAETQIYELEAKLKQLRGETTDSDDLGTLTDELSRAVAFQLDTLSNLASESFATASAFETLGESLRDFLGGLQDESIMPGERFLQDRAKFNSTFMAAMDGFDEDAQSAMNDLADLAESMLSSAKQAMPYEDYSILKARTVSRLTGAAKRSELQGEYGSVAGELYTAQSGLLARVQEELQSGTPDLGFTDSANSLFSTLSALSDAAKDVAEGAMSKDSFTGLAKKAASELLTADMKRLIDGTLDLKGLDQNQARLMLSSLDALEALEKYTGQDVDLSDGIRLQLETIAAGVSDQGKWQEMIDKMDEGREDYISWIEQNILTRKAEADRLYDLQEKEVAVSGQMLAYFSAMAAYLEKQTNLETIAASIATMQSKASSYQTLAMMAMISGVPMVGMMHMQTVQALNEQIASLTEQLQFWATREVPIPEFGLGGLVTERTLATVGESGPEAIVPLQGGAIPVRISNPSNTDNNALREEVRQLREELVAVSKKIADNTNSTALHTYKTSKAIERSNLAAEGAGA